MIGTTLGDIREHIESLASDDGRYYLRCGRYGDRPVPADDLTFRSRATARAAARATEQYHATLRRYDTQMPFYDVIVCEKPVETATAPPWEKTPDEGDADDGDDTAGVAGETAAEGIVDFCHTVSGVVFEAIAASAHVGLENAVMETYLETVETIEHPDELCLRLLESIAMELDDRLNPAEQAKLLRTAASNLPAESIGAVSTTEKPLAGVLGDLTNAGLLDSYRLRPRSDVPSDGVSWRVRLEGYALGRDHRRVVTLPLVVALFDRLATGSVTVTDAELLEDQAWTLTVATEPTSPPQGLACAHPPES